jgi:hypothetical protein
LFLAVLTIALLFGALPVSAVAFPASPTSYQATTCNPETDLLKANSTLVVNGGTATATLTNISASCTYNVGLASYRVFGLNASGKPVISDQVIFDWETISIGPGQTVELQVELPECKSQIDLFYGRVLLTNPAYGTRLIRAIVSDGPLCDRENCTLTQGFWKTHADAWPITSMMLGTREYSQDELLAILNTPVQGNGLIALAYQLIAAKLNIAQGASPTAVLNAIVQADALINGSVIPPVGSGFADPSTTSSLVTKLDNYNNGVTGPGHCDD